MKSVTVIDYGIGNIRSVINALESVGYSVTFTREPEKIRQADRLILPGVGAFQPAMKKLESTGLVPEIYEHVKKNRPLLGICLGMQLLGKGSTEFGYYPGLGLIDMDVVEFTGVPKSPHMGWNTLNLVDENHPVFRNCRTGEFVYFVHSFYAPVTSSTIATTDYFGSYSSIVAHELVIGMQFHPEKSAETGLKLLKNFGEI